MNYYVTVDVDGSMHGFRVRNAKSKAEAEEIAEKRAADKFPGWEEIFSVATEVETFKTKRNPRKRVKISTVNRSIKRQINEWGRAVKKRAMSQTAMLRKTQKNPSKRVQVEYKSKRGNKWNLLFSASDTDEMRLKANTMARRISQAAPKMKLRVIVK